MTSQHYPNRMIYIGNQTINSTNKHKAWIWKSGPEHELIQNIVDPSHHIMICNIPHCYFIQFWYSTTISWFFISLHSRFSGTSLRMELLEDIETEHSNPKNNISLFKNANNKILFFVFSTKFFGQHDPFKKFWPQTTQQKYFHLYQTR